MNRRIPAEVWPLGVITVVAAADAAFPKVTLAPLLVSAPLVGSLVLPTKRVAAIGLVALLVVVPLSVADHIWGSISQAWIAAAVVGSTVVGIWLAREAHVRIAADHGLMAKWANRQNSNLESAVTRSDVAPVVIDGLYRAICGRVVRPAELAAGVVRLRSPDDLAELASELRASEDGAIVTVDSVVPALRSYLRRDFDRGRSDDSVRMVFLHFMKVGGTSLSDAFAQWLETDQARVHMYVDDLVLTPAPVLAGLRLLAGHFPYHALSLIPGRFTTVTVLRDPFERTVSHFSTLKRSEPDFAELTLDRFVADEAFDAVVRNYQARQLTHDIDLREAWISYSPEQRLLGRGGKVDVPNPLAALFDADPLTTDDGELLARAAQNLDAIDIVGTTDQLERVAAAAASIFGRPGGVNVGRLNRSSPLPSGSLTDAIRRRVEAKTEVDRELYRLAVERSARLTDGDGPQIR